jgi:hypothetical protein
MDGKLKKALTPAFEGDLETMSRENLSAERT